MIVAISDVHIDAPNSDIGAFVAFLNDVLMRRDADNITDLVLCGDILDFWRCDVMDMVLESGHIMNRLIYLADRGINIHYIAGNHDYIMRKAESKHKHTVFNRY
ncbi:MAG: metallophosphoesterase [Euryarchaeota archaeon]|nr:metallophosphoesterase [Euryarchaeota archaeon]